MSEERKHSILAPSSKEWFHCGYAAKFLANKEEETNDASEFGSECHALAERYIRQSLKLKDYDAEENISIEELKKGFKHYSEEMETLANGYANFVVGIVDLERKRTGEEPIVLVEQFLEMDYAEDTHGTLDCGIIAGDTLTIIDNAYGENFWVEFKPEGYCTYRSSDSEDAELTGKIPYGSMNRICWLHSPLGSSYEGTNATCPQIIVFNYTVAKSSYSTIAF